MPGIGTASSWYVRGRRPPDTHLSALMSMSEEGGLSETDLRTLTNGVHDTHYSRLDYTPWSPLLYPSYYHGVDPFRPVGDHTAKLGLSSLPIMGGSVFYSC